MSIDTPHAPGSVASPRVSRLDLLLLFVVLVFFLFALAWGQHDEVEAPPEPVDVSTRHACRDWQVLVAVTGVDELADATQAQRHAALEEFFPRAEDAAAVKDAEQARFLAIVEAITGARRLRDAVGPKRVDEALAAFEADLVDVTAACEQT